MGSAPRGDGAAVTESRASPGNARVTVPFDLPAGAAGVRIYRQWLVLATLRTNLAGVVTSNARRTDVR